MAGKSVQRRQSGTVIIIDPDAEAIKNLIERAYSEGAGLGLAVCTEDKAGPCPTRPNLGQNWAKQGQPR